MAFNPTKSQSLAIDAKTKGTLLVSAAAGSGKTAVLTERVIKRITDNENPVPADRLLVVTFTNAAAAEMRQRISDRLSSEIAKNPHNTKLIRQQMLLTKANICTIDAFCRSLAAEHFEKADISPEIRLMSPGQKETITKNAMDKTIEHFYGEEGARFFSLCDIFGGNSGEYNLSLTVQSIYDFLRSLPFPDEWMDETCKKYSGFTEIESSFFGQTLMEYAGALIKRTLASLESVYSEMQQDAEIFASRSQAVEYDIKSLEKMKEALKNGGWDNFKASLEGYEKLNFTGRVAKDHNEPLKEKIKDAHNNAAKTVSDLNNLFLLPAAGCRELALSLAGFIELLMDCVKYFAQSCKEEKQKAGVMDFADIEYAALDILVRRKDGKTEITETAKQICGNIDEVLVDEYQDTNDLQNTIFEALSNGGEKLFAVGDIKQSIYRFRQANPDIFIKLMNISEPVSDEDDICFMEGAKKITLAQNFRSRKGVCEAANFIFRLIMTPQVGGLSYNDEHRLVAAGDFPKRDGADFALHIIENSENEGSKIQAEAEHIVEIINDMMKRECITDAKSGALRKAKYSDFVILLRSAKNKSAEYANVLKVHGIPVSAEQKGDFFKSTEVKKITALLKVIDNPRNEVALLSAMLSPMFGFSAEDAAALKNKCKNRPLYSALDILSKANASYGEFKSQLERFRAMAVYMTSAELLEKIYDETSYLAAVQVMENGETRRINLLGLLTLAEEYSAIGYKGLSGFIRYLDAAAEGNISVPLPDASAATDSVKIMTVHHSKGLQFPVCFVADCGSKINRQDVNGSVLLDRSAGLGMMVSDDRGRRSTTFMRAAAAICIERASVSEELRVLYVAMTRASDNLFLLYTCDNLDTELKSAADIINRGVIKQGEQIDYVNVLKAKSFGRLVCACGLLHSGGAELRALAGITLTPLKNDTGFEIKIIKTSGVLNEMNAEKEEEEPEEQNKPQINIAEVEEITEKLHERLSWEYPYAALNSVAAKRSVSELLQKSEDLQYSFDIPEFANDGQITAAKKGTALHEFLHYADFKNAVDNINDEIERLVNSEHITRIQADSLDKTKLEKFLNSPLYKRSAASGDVRRELKFIYEVAAKSLDPSLPENVAYEPVVIQGTVDCVFIEDGKMIIVDYKAGGRDEKGLIETYAPQLNIYARALESIYKLNVSEKLIYSFALGKEIEVLE